LIGFEHFDCPFGLLSEIQNIAKLSIREPVTINLAIHSHLPQKIGNTSIALMESCHELMDAKFSADVKMVLEAEALPILGVLYQK
jgi:hypothetical protein